MIAIYSALLFLSGMTALVLEVAWFRRLAQLVGGTSIALAGVLAAVIGGMAIGAFLFGARADRSARPTRLYALLELGVTACAILSPWWLTNISGFFTSVLLLAPAAILMGGTLPALAAAARGRGLGWLYAFNTLGGVAGTLLAGFVLLPALGLATTMQCAAVGSGLAALGGFLVRGQRAEVREAIVGERWAVVLFAASGFLGMASEVAFTRQLVLVFGSSTYSFTTVLAVFLAGIGLGSAIGARLVRHVDPMRALSWTVIGTGALFAIAAYGAVFLPRLFLEAYVRWGDAFGTGLAVKFALTALVILPGAIGSGLAFPLAAAAYARGQVGKATGRLYGANTLASIIGSTCAVFVFVPALGPHRTIAVIALVVALLAARTRMQWLAAGLVAITLLNQPQVARERLHVGVYYAPQRYVRNGEIDHAAWEDGVDLPFTKFGREATVSLFRWYGPQSLLVDGKAVATEQSVGDVQHLELLGHLPMAMKRDASVLVVGLGLGTTYRAVAKHRPPSLQVVEIEQAVADAVATLGLRPDQLVIDDARRFLRTTTTKFDVITSDPIHPWVRGGGDLYTKEYFELCRDALAPGGVVCHWLPLYQMGFEDVRAVARTFSSVFRTAVYFAGTDLVLVGTIGGAPPTPRKTATVFGEDLTLLRVADHDGLLRALTGAGMLTDDALQLEFSAPRHLASPELAQILGWVRELWGQPSEPYGAILGAQIAAANGDGAAMGEELQRALEQSPKHVFARRFAGETYLAAAAQFDSEPFLKQASLLLPPDDLRVAGVRADLYARLGRKQAAAQIYRSLLVIEPGNRYIQRRLDRVSR
ncbi:MAG: fused MFS/spermidine synthase [Planctomycetota bacterium]